MLETYLLLALVVVVALAFDFTNGFHDTANAIATSVSTRALAPRPAVIIAALLNVLGAFLNTEVADTIGGLLTIKVSLVVVLSALIGALVWDLVTWYYGIPSSSSHALIGGLIGAATTAVGRGSIRWDKIGKVFAWLALSPLVGVLVGFLVMLVLLWLLRRFHPGPLNRGFRLLQIVSASFMSFSHGSNDAQKTMGVITLALVSTGLLPRFRVPWYVILLAAMAMGLGTYVGGWRIIRTMGSRIIKLDPVHGFAAEATASSVILISTHLGLPVSTTHNIAGAIMGVGATQRLSAVKWGVAMNIFLAWVLTIPFSAIIAANAYLFLRFPLGE